MTKKSIHIAINFPGGIVPVPALKNIAQVALTLGIPDLRFGRRQQLMADVPAVCMESFLSIMKGHELAFSTGYPNIVSSCVTEEMNFSPTWVKGGVYKDILASFDYRPRLSINLVDPNQHLVSYDSGQLNFVASGMGNYWHLLYRMGERLVQWKSLVYSGNIARLCHRIEDALLRVVDSAGAQAAGFDEEAFYHEVMEAEDLLEQIPETPLQIPDFALPYYEGFNRGKGDRWWLGIYRREERFSASFLTDLCALCEQSAIAQLFVTPWKSLMVHGIRQSERKRWDILLGRHGINVRHSLGELSWQVEDGSDEGLSLKHYLVRQFDRDDVRIFGLCFGIQLQESSGLYPLVLIKLQPGLKPLQRKALDRYEIWYRKDFDVNEDQYILFRKDVEKEHLAPYLKSLCKYFYECEAGEDQLLHHVYRQKDAPVKAALVHHSYYQCRHCYTRYDERIGDPDAQIPAGTAFEKLAFYACPVCGADQADFLPITQATDGILCI